MSNRSKSSNPLSIVPRLTQHVPEEHRAEFMNSRSEFSIATELRFRLNQLDAISTHPQDVEGFWTDGTGDTYLTECLKATNNIDGLADLGMAKFRARSSK